MIREAMLEVARVKESRAGMQLSSICEPAYTRVFLGCFCVCVYLSLFGLDKSRSSLSLSVCMCVCVFMCQYTCVCMRVLTTLNVPALTCTDERARKRERLLKSLEAIEQHTIHREHEREVRKERRK
jgi:hypothetical protein